jgi:hypothetical protein
MDIFVVPIIVAVSVFVLFMLFYLIGLASGKSKRKKYQTYILQQFPHLQGQDFLMAKQVSMKLNPSIALIIDPTKNEMILMFEAGAKGCTHIIYPFASLRAVTRTSQILSRGALPKTYSYEEAISLAFADSRTYLFIVETISNQYGNDKGAEAIRNIMSPWEQKLQALLPKNAPPPSTT